MKKTDWSSEVWSELSTAVFGVNTNQNRKWLYVVWKQNRRGLRTHVMKPKSYDDKGSEKSADHPSPLEQTDSDGERGVPPEPADHPSPVGLTDSDRECGVAPEPADHPSPVSQKSVNSQHIETLSSRYHTIETVSVPRTKKRPHQSMNKFNK